MAVATIGAASLAPIFQELCDQVTQSMEKNTKLKTLLGFFQSTLNSFRDRIIQPVQEGQQIFHDQDDKIESVVVELQKGAKLIAKVSKLRSWSYFWLDEYTEKLLELDRYFRRLLETTWVREFRVVRQQNRDVNHLMDGMLRRMFDAYKKAVEAETVPLRAETAEAAVEEERGVGKRKRRRWLCFGGCLRR
ncbi:putative powdery mildew resistance protein, RPW8 [Rosa chinensis]|uniref:Putative powdery mildew resistance protein, RPW8 n=1 Tax=Rosa chinensis TaxID=74649 RepID=A0A2P6PXB6_ROSCH|nr:putative powdery mildew resistance protein, RPW8 [Rosa chinensis]